MKVIKCFLPNFSDVVDNIVQYAGAQALNGGYTSANFGSGTGEIVFRLVYCNGNETRLSQCRVVHTFCSHSEDSGVRCKYDGMIFLL